MSTVILDIEKEKIIAPQLRFQEFNREWTKTKLGEKMEIFRGASPRPKGDPKYYGGTVPRLMIQDATRDGKYTIPKIDFLTEEGSKKSRLLKKGNVVLSCSGTKVAIPTILGIDACIHDGWLAFRKFKDIQEEFLYYLFVKLHERMQGEATTGGVFNNLTTSILRDLKFGFPSFQEQQKIASFLNAVDEKIQQLSRKKELLEQYKKGVMQQLFSGKLRFKDENGEDYPEWEEKKLGEVCESIKSGKSNSSEQGRFPLYGSTGIIGKCIEYSHEGLFILIARVGANAGMINLIEDKFGVSDNTLVLNCNQSSYTDYLFHYLGYFNLNRLVFGSGQPLITGGQLKSLKLNLPSFLEQQKIANFLSSIDDKIESTNQQITQTQTFKKGLLQQMFV